MIGPFLKKLIKYYLEKLLMWLRMLKFNLELDSEIDEYHKALDKRDKERNLPRVIEEGVFGEDRWSISISSDYDRDSRDRSEETGDT